MTLREQATAVVQRLRQAGHAAFWVGGCVRDLLMELSPKDFDIATSATPEQVAGLFPRTLAVGAQFGVMIVLENGFQFEVSTFRSDGVYEDGRHPRQVVYSTDPRQDVMRRDFTINGLLYDPMEGQVLDYVGGEDDIKQRLLRAIGHPEERFAEDKLRLLRAVRFASRFKYDIEPSTQRAIEVLAHHVTEVSAERIRDEILKILVEGYARQGMQLMEACGLLKVVLPEVSALQGVAQPPQFHPEGDVWNHALLMLSCLDNTRDLLPLVPSPELAIAGYPSETLAVAVLLHDIGKPPTFEQKDRIRFNRHAEVGASMSAAICQRLRFSNRQTERIIELVRDHLHFIELRKMRLSTLKRFLRREGFAEHLELHRLDCLASHGNLNIWQFAADSYAQLGPAEIKPPRILTGDTLIQMGYPPGPEFQQILRSIEDAQLEGHLHTTAQACRFVLERFPMGGNGKLKIEN